MVGADERQIGVGEPIIVARERPVAAGVVVRLRGHGTAPAELRATRYPPGAWLARVLLFAVAGIAGTALTLVFTFDPFVASFPFVLGIGLVYHGIRGRYRVDAFRGSCPRCKRELRIRPGSKISLPHPMTCYECHHEPELTFSASRPTAV